MVKPDCAGAPVLAVLLREGSAAGPTEQGASLARTHLDRGPHSRGRPMTSATGITSSSPRRMVTALFDRRSDAENAIGRLVNAGVPQDRIGLMPGDESDASDDAGASSRPEPRGFWGSLGDWLLPDEDRHVYAEGLSRGGYLISVTTGDEPYARVMAILDSEDAIDVDERAESWRSEGGWAGWSGTAAGTFWEVGSATSACRVFARARAEDREMRSAVASPRKTGLAGAETSLSECGEHVIPVVEERLRIGKRDVSHGRVRIRAYVVETPVEEQGEHPDNPLPNTPK